MLGVPSLFMTVQELFSKDGVWCQENLALNAQDQPVEPQDPSAVKFCLIGAIYRCYDDDVEKLFSYQDRVFEVIRSRCPDARSTTSWNDRAYRTIQEIREVAKEAGI